MKTGIFEQIPHIASDETKNTPLSVHALCMHEHIRTKKCGRLLNEGTKKCKTGHYSRKITN